MRERVNARVKICFLNNKTFNTLQDTYREKRQGGNYQSTANLRQIVLEKFTCYFETMQVSGTFV